MRDNGPVTTNEMLLSEDTLLVSQLDDSGDKPIGRQAAAAQSVTEVMQDLVDIASRSTRGPPTLRLDADGLANP